MKQKNVLIFGITGQDGYYLSSKLLKLNFKVYGTSRKNKKIEKIKKNTLDLTNISKCDIKNYHEVYNIIDHVKPNYIFNLINIETLRYSYEYPNDTYEIIYKGNLNILESIIKIDKKIKYFSSSSSEIFGDNLKGSVNEETIFKPNNVYGIAKSNSFELIDFYRKKFSLFCLSGILFNHDSPIRHNRYLINDIINGCFNIKNGKQDKIFIDNFYSKFDIGWAPEYITAMFLCLKNDHPMDYIIASGKTHSVHELVKKIFYEFKLNYKDYVVARNISQNEIRNFYNFDADTSKIKKILNWQSNKDISYIIKNIINSKK